MQPGFDDADALLPNDNRIFRGFDFLREYFMFPRKFLGFKLDKLAAVMPRLPAKSVDILFAFDEVNNRLPAAVQPGDVRALCRARRQSVREDHRPRRRSGPTSTNTTSFRTAAAISISSRTACSTSMRTIPAAATRSRSARSIRRRPRAAVGFGTSGTRCGACRGGAPSRRRSTAPRPTIPAPTCSSRSVEPAGIEDDDGVSELSVRALCSNRHLTEHLPVGEGGADFRLLDDVTLDVVCIAGPTPPREPVVGQLRSRSETAHTGTVTWRLINMLSLNHLGLVERGAGKNGQSLRETLSMFADLQDSATERKIRGVRSVDSRPVVRRVHQRTGSGIARGTEVTVTLDERAFEGSGAFLLGAILDRFFCEYSALNHFTQTVIRTTERGEIMRWPVRIGLRRPL